VYVCACVDVCMDVRVCMFFFVLNFCNSKGCTL